MKQALNTTAAALTATLMATGASADCVYGDHNLSVNAPAKIYDTVCEAVVDTIKIFEEDFGYTGRSFMVNTTVQDEVYFVLNDADHRVFGIYDSNNHQSFVSSPDTEYAQNRTVFLSDKTDKASGLPMTMTLWDSIVTHETAHQIIHQLWLEADLPQRKLGGGSHEYVAYIVQMLSLTDEEQEQILNQYPGLEPLTSGRVNSIYHGMLPHRYGVAAYLSFKEHGQAWIDEIVKGNLDNDRNFVNGTY